jgi:hypothetical protein
MSLRFHWFLPTNGDGRDIVGGGHGIATGAAGAIRPATLGYLGQIARSAEQLGFEAALTPTGMWRSGRASSRRRWPLRWPRRSSVTRRAACC